MQRKWRTNPGALETVVAYPDFRAAIPPRDADYTLADPTDIYSVYTVLHIERKQAELRWSSHGGFYYFLAQWEQEQAVEGQPQQHTAAPEGDEDPPPQIVPEGSTTMQPPVGAAAQGGSRAGKRQQRPPQQQQQHSQQDAQHQAAAGDQQQPVQQQDDAAAPAAHAQQEAAAGQAPLVAAAAQPPKLRTQIVVPVSSGCRNLTPRLLQRLFSVRGVQAQQLLLALVDSNGVVTRSCLYNYIQAPLEGPGTANLELLDD